MKRIAVFFSVMLVLVSNMVFAKTIDETQLLNTTLIGLDVAKPKEKNVFKKYHTNFGSACYGGVTAIYINKATSRLYLFNGWDTFKESKLPEGTVTFEIVNIQNKEGVLSVEAKNAQVKELTLKFSTADDVIYALRVHRTGSLDASDVLVNFRTVYVKKAIKRKFKEEDCGDFQG